MMKTNVRRGRNTPNATQPQNTLGRLSQNGDSNDQNDMHENLTIGNPQYEHHHDRRLYPGAEQTVVEQDVYSDRYNGSDVQYDRYARIDKYGRSDWPEGVYRGSDGPILTTSEWDIGRAWDDGSNHSTDHHQVFPEEPDGPYYDMGRPVRHFIGSGSG